MGVVTGHSFADAFAGGADAADGAGAAHADASRAAVRSGVVVRPLAELADLAGVIEVVNGIWKPGTGEPLLTVELLRALSHAGNYVVGAFDGAEMIGGCVGFLARTPDVALHSHIAGVSSAARGRSVGFALKLHQRAWALERGLTHVTWTADPLVRRNAYFNLVKLGARPVEYLVDFYGDIDDAINAGQGTDRILLRWDLTSRAVTAASQGGRRAAGADRLRHAVPVLLESESGQPRPIPDDGDARAVLVGVPADIESMRGRDHALARAWRMAVRTVLGDLMNSGATVTGFAAPGWYVVERDKS